MYSLTHEVRIPNQNPPLLSGLLPGENQAHSRGAPNWFWRRRRPQQARAGSRESEKLRSAVALGQTRAGGGRLPVSFDCRAIWAQFVFQRCTQSIKT